ncbi:putative dihydroxyacetone kinase [Zopfochytrium polystomum]|nr:putative dihydroxyacetone kinase [Zopfochytrium polystomum]
MLDGILLSHPHLRRIRGASNVLVHRDYAAIAARQVTLISGGGSGHEPAHAGYIGDGMLTAAVCGGVFASPSTAQVLAAIRCVGTGPHGCLVIVKNYTGDRINFGLAVEMARAEGRAVEMVVVGEDVAVDSNAGKRGLAGTVLIHKLAGAAAARGMSLEDIVDLVNGIVSSSAPSLGTMGVALRACTLPGRTHPSRSLADDEVELGLGIHGEPGVERRSPQPPLADIVAHLVDAVTAKTHPSGGGNGGGDGAGADANEAVLLVNNLGGTTAMELHVVTAHAVRALRARGIRVRTTLAAPLVTALDMVGFSLTVWNPRRDARLHALLGDPTTAPAWPHRASSANGGVVGQDGAIDASSADAQASSSPSLSVARRCVAAGAAALVAREAELTAWDARLGDGDCGHTLRAAAEAVLADLDAYPLSLGRGGGGGGTAAAAPATQQQQLLRAIAGSVGRAAGGTSGALYRIFFLAAAAAPADATDGNTDGGGRGWWAVAALEAGTRAVMACGGAREGMRTMVDALAPAARAAREAAATTTVAGAAGSGSSAAAAAGVAAAAARAARYVGEEFGRDVPDPGAMAVVYWMEAVAEVLAADAKAAGAA